MYISPLFYDFGGVRRIHRRVGATMPNGNSRPSSKVWGCLSHEIAPLPRRTRPALIHILQRLLHIVRSAVRKTGDDCATGEYFGIVGKQHGGHSASRGEACYKYSRRVDLMRRYHARDHLTD